MTVRSSMLAFSTGTRVEMEHYIPQGYPVFTLGAAPSRHADQPRQFTVSVAVGSNGNQFEAFLQIQFAADDQLNAALLGGPAQEAEIRQAV